MISALHEEIEERDKIILRLRKQKREYESALYFYRKAEEEEHNCFDSVAHKVLEKWGVEH